MRWRAGSMQNGVPCCTLIHDLLPLAFIDWKEQHMVADLPNKDWVKGRLKSVCMCVKSVKWAATCTPKSSKSLKLWSRQHADRKNEGGKARAEKRDWVNMPMVCAMQNVPHWAPVYTYNDCDTDMHISKEARPRTKKAHTKTHTHPIKQASLR